MSRPSAAVLVHNLGHRELFLHLRDNTGAEHLARPDGIACWSIGTLLQEAMGQGGVTLEATGGATVRLHPPLALPWSASVRSSRLRGRGDEEVPLQGAVQILALSCPLLVAAVRAVEARHADRTCVAVLVSNGPGEGDEGDRGPSTHRIAQVLQTLLGALHPAWQVERLERRSEQPWHFEREPALAGQLERVLSRLRRPVVDAWGDAWENAFAVYLSANTGTVAAIAGLLMGLQSHRPSMVHVAMAYRWPEQADGVLIPQAELVDRDTLAQRPPLREQDLQDEAWKLAVHEMQQWRDDFRRDRPTPPGGDLDAESKFWFRKGQKEVLAVLVVRDPVTGALRAHRGVNLEVSLPTGTLCAERNAIGTAFAANPRLRRRDILAVAVLSLDHQGIGSRLGPCGACQEWLRKVAEIHPDFRVITFGEPTCREEIYVQPVDG
jgi:cytidine deaminase